MDSAGSAAEPDRGDGLVGLFSDAVDCLGRIHIAHGIGKDFSMCQMKLNVARLRLTRWGSVVGLTNLPTPEQAAAAGQQETVAVTSVSESEALLRQIIKSFTKVEKFSQKKTGDRSSVEGSYSYAHSQVERLALRRRARTGIAAGRKSEWIVLEERKRFSELFEHVTRTIDGLEALVIPAKLPALERSCESEIRAIHSMSAVEEFTDAAKDQDKLLSRVIEEWHEARMKRIERERAERESGERLQ